MHQSDRYTVDKYSILAGSDCIFIYLYIIEKIIYKICKEIYSQIKEFIYFLKRNFNLLQNLYF